MKAIVYARFSPRRNADTSESIEVQVSACRTFCADQDHEVMGEFEDRALSGKDEERPGLWNAVSALRRDYLLVVYRLDRLARSVYLSDIIERTVRKRGAAIISASGEGTWADSDEDWLIRKILHALAEYECRVIAARTRTAMLRHQAAGRRMSRWAPMGWAVDPNDAARLVCDEEEQRILERIIEMRRQGMGTTGIAKVLQTEGVVFRGSSRWHERTIARVLKREGAW